MNHLSNLNIIYFTFLYLYEETLESMSVQTYLTHLISLKKNLMQKVSLNKIKCSYKKYNENLWCMNKHLNEKY